MVQLVRLVKYFLQDFTAKEILWSRSVDGPASYSGEELQTFRCGPTRATIGSYSGRFILARFNLSEARAQAFGLIAAKSPPGKIVRFRLIYRSVWQWLGATVWPPLDRVRWSSRRFTAAEEAHVASPPVCSLRILAVGLCSWPANRFPKWNPLCSFFEFLERCTAAWCLPLPRFRPFSRSAQLSTTPCRSQCPI